MFKKNCEKYMIIKSIKVVNNYYAGSKEIIKRARTIFLAA